MCLAPRNETNRSNEGANQGVTMDQVNLAIYNFLVELPALGSGFQRPADLPDVPPPVSGGSRTCTDMEIFATLWILLKRFPPLPVPLPRELGAVDADGERKLYNIHHPLFQEWIRHSKDDHEHFKDIEYHELTSDVNEKLLSARMDVASFVKLLVQDEREGAYSGSKLVHQLQLLGKQRDIIELEEQKKDLAAKYQLSCDILLSQVVPDFSNMSKYYVWRVIKMGDWNAMSNAQKEHVAWILKKMNWKRNRDCPEEFRHGEWSTSEVENVMAHVRF